MANTFAPYGFRPVRRVDGAAWTANLSVAKIAQANTHQFYNGDPVKQLSTGYIDVVATSAVQVAGIFVGCKYFSTSQQKVVWYPTFQGADAAADIEAYIINDPWVVMQVQVGAAGPVAGGPVTQAAIGNNISYGGQSSGNATNGISAAYADYATIATTTTLPFRIIGLVTAPPGANGTDTTTAGNVIEVTFNNQDYKSLTGI